MNITLEQIKELHTSLWDNAVEEYGDKFKVPFEVIHEMSQQTRALYVLQTWNGSGNPARYLASYSIPTDVITETVSKYCNETVTEEELLTPRPRRADKYDALIDWAKEHLFEQFTTEQLMEVSGFSYQTTLKFIQESPTFRKIKKGLWEIRDADADKKAEKNS
jgi:hypothetical protein